MGAKTDTATTKYEIHADFTVIGIVEKPDIIGALYGQTDGLLSDELDIRELQKTGKIGRIDVNLSSKEGITTGEIIIPSGLSRTETAILAATLETVDRVGPCNCTIKLNEIVDVRIKKRKTIVNRAAEIIRQWDEKVSPFTASLQLEVEKSSKKAKTGRSSSDITVIKVSNERFYAGSGFEKANKVILVEGRADIINLQKAGIDNTIAVNGTYVPKKILELIKNRTVTAFLDGDRGADLILKELIQVAHVKYVARAPPEKEVEDLSAEEIRKALNNAVPIEKAVFLTGEDKGLTVSEFLKKNERKQQKEKRFYRKNELQQGQDKAYKREETGQTSHEYSKRQQQYRYPKAHQPRASNSTHEYSKHNYSSFSQKEPSKGGRYATNRRTIRKVNLPDELAKAVEAIKQHFEALVLDENYNTILKSSTVKIFDELEEVTKAKALVVDGVITQRLLEKAYTKGISLVIGARIADLSKKPASVRIIDYNQI